MKRGKGMESVKQFCPTETNITASMRVAKDTGRYDTRGSSSSSRLVQMLYLHELNFHICASTVKKKSD